MIYKLTTVRQRKEVYKAALKLYEKGETNNSMCCLLTELSGVMVYDNIKKLCPELWEQRPEYIKKDAGQAWFDFNSSGTESRISALKAAIRECERKIKKVKV